MTTTPSTTVSERPRAKRGRRPYSKAFTPHGDTGKDYLLSRVPAGLYSAVRTRARREGLSLRALILHLLTEWVNRPDDTISAARIDELNDIAHSAQSLAERLWETTAQMRERAAIGSDETGGEGGAQ